MKIYDTFLLGSGPQDLDLLECRLYELDGHDVVYKHVIVEGLVTFTGLPKPLYYQDHKDRFSRWAHKIRYVPIMPSTAVAGKQPGDAWARENSSRQACRLGLLDAEPDDLIIHGDVDEILSSAAIRDLAVSDPQPGPFKLKLRHFSFAVDWEQPQPWFAPSVARYSQIGSFTELRENPWHVFPHVGHWFSAGWHLSWLGGADAMEIKVNSFSHTEQAGYITEGIAAGRYLERGEFWPGPGHETDYQLTPVDVDYSWPRWVAERRCPEVWFRPRGAATLTLHSDAPLFGPQDPRSRPVR